MNNKKSYEMGKYTFSYDLQKCSWKMEADGRTCVKDAYASVKVGEKLYIGTDYTALDWSEEEIQDQFGTGKRLIVILKKENAPVLKQNFCFYEDKEYFLTELECGWEDCRKIGTNYIVPLAVDTAEKESGKRYFLRVPYDNDTWVKFELNEINGADTGFEAAAILDEQMEKALILGSLSHDTWKTGIDYTGEEGQLQTLRIYGGANHKWTRDLSPHGTVTGQTVKSPLMMVGYFEDWKAGMDIYAEANTKVAAPKMDGGSVPFGWNSWGSVQDDINLKIANEISDYIHDNFQTAWITEEKDVVYTVLDSYWDNMTDEELADFAAHCKANGQKPGIYWAPFVSWHSQDRIETLPVEGSEGVVYQEIILKKADGTYYGKELDGASPVDITHPAAQKRVDFFMDRFKKAGFEYIKLDFLVHGALEGKRYDPSIETGTQAYNYGMKYVLDRLEGQMYVNLSIAPTFPYQYCNGKRIACDAYYSIGEIEYTLNGLTYGFWQKKLYQYPDPDHLVVLGKDGKASPNEARSRVTSGILLGTSFLSGDNFISPAMQKEEADARFRQVFTNPDILHAAKAGKIFYPLAVSCGLTAADMFYRKDEDAVYLAVFNYGEQDTYHMINLVELLGVSADAPVKELWSGEKSEMQDGLLSIHLDGAESKVYRIG